MTKVKIVLKVCGRRWKRRRKTKGRSRRAEEKEEERIRAAQIKNEKELICERKRK